MSSPDAKTINSYIQATRRTAARVGSVEQLARLKRFRSVNQLDATEALNFTNGTLDLDTLDLRPHRPEDLLAYCLPYAFDAEATAPRWQDVLSHLDSETSAFLQEYSGLTLTPDTSHEIAVWLYGPPGGGKSTFLEGLMAMLDSRATVLGLADVELNRFALAALPGKTLIVASEQPADYMAATHRLNALISGEPVMVDRKYREAITITPRAKVIWAMNELPRIKGAGDGIFRRVKVVEFPAIPPEKRDLELKSAVISEAPGILNWALEGLRRLRDRRRFVVPTKVEASTRAFVERNDIPALFVSECCDCDPQFKVGGQELYNAYRDWCEENGHRAQSSTTIAIDWERLGFERRRINGRSMYLGLTVQS